MTDDVAVSLFAGLLVIALLCGFVIYFLFSYRNKQKSYRLLQKQKQEIDKQRNVLEHTLAELKKTQNQLIYREKMASLGELLAGIAHEIQNPLNFVNNFSDLNRELLAELDCELEAGNMQEVKLIAKDVSENEKKIQFHGKRANLIVKGMLDHSRPGSGQKQLTDINLLTNDFSNIAYKGLKAKDPLFDIEIIKKFGNEMPLVNIIQQDMGRVLLNILNNAFYAVKHRSKTEGNSYKPCVTITTEFENEMLLIKIEDNGHGVPNEILDKIMLPFFTTKPSGEGTGLGLSLSYDMIVKGHGGSIDIKSEEDKYTLFTIKLPVES